MTEYVGEQGKIDRAQRVEKLLNDPEFSAAFENTRSAIFSAIERTPIRDVEGLTQLRLCLKLLGDVKANMVQALNDGKTAEFNVEQRKSLKFGFYRGSKQ